MSPILNIRATATGAILSMPAGAVAGIVIGSIIIVALAALYLGRTSGGDETDTKTSKTGGWLQKRMSAITALKINPWRRQKEKEPSTDAMPLAPKAQHDMQREGSSDWEDSERPRKEGEDVKG
ncbi:hypothetical protein B0H63DRAFT_521405 [Podospora didyma]|uniref:Uncharacterized protein n=1 Tax=Podospora didyma TaxID=330526 RepID=A0AAE0NTE0_9PEZI|nr:hypothetical protein B0H63DRAFT_521405 [Podospora didyma]